MDVRIIKYHIGHIVKTPPRETMTEKLSTSPVVTQHSEQNSNCHEGPQPLDSSCVYPSSHFGFLVHFCSLVHLFSSPMKLLLSYFLFHTVVQSLRFASHGLSAKHLLLTEVQNLHIITTRPGVFSYQHSWA